MAGGQGEERGVVAAGGGGGKVRGLLGRLERRMVSLRSARGEEFWTRVGERKRQRPRRFDGRGDALGSDVERLDRCL